MTGDLLRRQASEATASQAVAAAIAGALSEAGTRLVFGVPGGGPNLDVVGAVADAGLRFVLAHGETAAAIMAATCADLTGSPGAVVVTRGPGLASGVNGIAHAALDRLPLVVVADTVPARDAGRISHQRLDQDALGGSVAKATVTADGNDAERAAGLAVRLALVPPAGPVVVNVDPDGTAGPRPPVQATDGRAGADEPADVHAHALAALGDALGTARRPVVLVGLGALRHAAAVRAALAGSGIPVLHTYRARGIVPDRAAEAAGLFTGGTMESPLLAAADLIIGLGVDPVELIPASWDYPAPAFLATEYPAGSARYFTGGTEIVTPLPAAAHVLAAHRAGHRWPEAAGRTAKRDVIERLGWVAVAAPGRLTPQDVVITAREIAPAQAIATVDSGAHMLAVMPLWLVDEPQRLLISSGLATMGYALPAAIGAALCSPGVPVIAFTGDGGLGMTLMEIETAVRLGLRVIVIVFNDSALSLIKIKQRASGQGGDEAVGYGPTSFAAAAEAMGAAAASAGDPAELAAALTTALGRDGPTLIDARVDPAGYPALLDLTRGSTGRHSSRSWGDVDPRRTRKLRTRGRRGDHGSTRDLGSGSRRAGHRRGRA
ncbi:MAG TPA: thiamine pyrophosphate-dependent enzyme [Streptosporangiaceae bacterium]|nr:thiamine pyrophosphate-dependent enzyme [Streptosporangiaceae bacterium]